MPDLDQLTTRQREVYEFIREKIHGRGYGPTVREIGTRFKISSPNGVMCHLKALEKKGLIAREPNMSRAITMTSEAASDRGLPLVGRIAAGALQEAVEQSERIDLNEFFGSKEMFVLKVSGDSMIDAHIDDGDYVIVRRQQSAQNGQIVAAMTDENDATLKYWYREENRIRLQPANSRMKPIYVKDAVVLGVVIGVVRKV
ncbi:MAG: transcriptional repressor LexA [Pirellulales bacterium]